MMYVSILFLCNDLISKVALLLSEISLIQLIKIFATVLRLWCADLIHWGFLDAF
jgi:hypothetical protein